MAFHSPFRDDPFFSDVGFPTMAFPAFPDPFGTHSLMAPRGSRGARTDPFQNMLMPFGGPSLMSSMLSDMERMRSSMSNNGGHCYSSSSVMHYSSGGLGQKPRIFQASSATRSGPGGVKETKKAVRDSETAVQKMSVSHQIGDCSHTIEKKCNMRTREAEEHHSLVNLDHDDVPEFNRQWMDTTRRYRHMLDTDHGRHHKARRQGLPPVTPYPHSRPHRVVQDPFASERVNRAENPVAFQQRPQAPLHSQRDPTSLPMPTHQEHCYPSRPVHVDSVHMDSLPRASKKRVHIVD